MSIYPVSATKEQELLALMQRLNVREEDLIEKFIRASGPGGQKINKSSSCVYLQHVPTGLEVKCQRDRSQAMNRFLARRDLCEKIQEKVLGEKTKRRQEIEKLKRQKRKRSKRAKEKMLDQKRKQSEKKGMRKKIGDD